MEHVEIDWETAYIEPDKLNLYLLNPKHPKGGSKAVLLLRRGYDANTLEQDLLHIAHSCPVSVTELHPPYGVRYTKRGVVESPSGRPTTLRTIWEVRPENLAPRLLTAYPDYN